jgi:predicted RNase H-like HicB family nuclease
MQIPVLIEPVAGNGYRARGIEPFGLSAEGGTREEALRRLRALIQERVNAGAEVALLDLPGGEHPWAPFAGTLRDDPMLDAWIQAMADYRRKVEEDPDIP